MKVAYVGPSMIDGAPIVTLLTERSTNDKTGDMVQSWTMRADKAPHSAVKALDDRSVCGDCPHRHGSGGACYVVPFQAPLSVWRAWIRRGKPGAMSLDQLKAFGRGKAIRIGSYGDPAAIPVTVWRALAAESSLHTGYTHQWRTAPALRDLCMASVDSAEEHEEATARGWRTFGVIPVGEELPAKGSGRVECPSERGVSCIDCGACNGSRPLDRRVSIAIMAHGARAKKFLPTVR